NPESWYLIPDAVAEIASPEFPGERLMVCLNPRRREELLSKTEEVLREIAAAAARGKPGPGNHDRALKALGRRANRGKVEKHFRIEVRDDGVFWSRNRGRIAAEARLDGVYVVRTSLGASDIGADRAVEAYKALSRVERAFRTMKTSRLEVRPVFVYGEERVRAHVFLCMLACHVEWHMRRSLAPILFEDDDPAGAAAKRATPVETAEVSDRAKEGEIEEDGGRPAGPQHADAARRPRDASAQRGGAAGDPRSPPGHSVAADEAAGARVRPARNRSLEDGCHAVGRTERRNTGDSACKRWGFLFFFRMKFRLGIPPDARNASACASYNSASLV
ncbi:MAG: hypothetical protein OXI87_18895, partial [Albidovulum sp.]|nr:hypothetical protein [Albidovulum sp.]